jgi:hypothetical protein
VVSSRLEEWRRLLHGSLTQGRGVLQRVLDGRIKLFPREEGYEFQARTKFSRLFAGLAVKLPVGRYGPDLKRMPGEGWRTCGRKDSMEADYERLLARAEGNDAKCWRPQRVAHTNARASQGKKTAQMYWRPGGCLPLSWPGGEWLNYPQVRAENPQRGTLRR